MNESVRNWLSERLGAEALLVQMRDRRIPSGSVPAYAGGVVVFLFLLQVATGILLMLPYRVDPAHAHESVEIIVGQVPFGSLMRGIHYWSSQLFVVGLFVYLGGMLVLGRYRKPFELVWLLGLVILLLGLGMAFTGVILPWNENGYLQARVSSEMLGQGPMFGSFLKRMLRGGDEITPWTLNHAFGFHVGVLPAASSFLLLLHLVVVPRRRPGVAALAGVRTISLYPDFVLRLSAVCIGVMSVVVTLATFVHVPLGDAADLRAVVTDSSPPWYLLAVHELLGAAPPRILGLESARFILGALSVLALFAAALPFVDRKGSRITAYLFFVLFAVWGLLTAHAVL